MAPPLRRGQGATQGSNKEPFFSQAQEEVQASIRRDLGAEEERGRGGRGEKLEDPEIFFHSSHLSLYLSRKSWPEATLSLLFTFTFRFSFFLL